MILNTTTGLHGELIAYRKVGNTDDGSVIWGYAIVNRHEPTFPDRPYSVHAVASYTDGGFVAGRPVFGGTHHEEASSGHYDLTLDEANTVFDSLTGGIK